MDSAINALKASLLDPESIKNSNEDPTIIFNILFSGKEPSKEKYTALLSRPDVDILTAFKFFKESRSVNVLFFHILDRIIQKFIMIESHKDSLRNSIILIYLWSQFICSEYKNTVNEKKLNEYMDLINPVTIVLMRRAVYRKSLINLLNDINECISALSLENLPHTYGSLNSELLDRVPPVFGKYFLNLIRENKFYKSARDLKAISLQLKYGLSGITGPMYIKSVENNFTLEDIKPYLLEELNDKYKPMAEFLLSSDGETAKNRLHILFTNEPAKEVMSILNDASYGDFSFCDNEEYKLMSLEKKSDFLEPYTSNNRLGYLADLQADRQCRLLRMWINDSEWKSPDIETLELVRLALNKKCLYSNYSIGMFTELIIVLLWRIYGDKVAGATISLLSFFYDLRFRNSKFINTNEYPDGFETPGVILAILDNEIVKENYSEFRKSAIIQAKIIFKNYLAESLPSFSVDEAYQLVKAAEAYDNINILKYLSQQNLRVDQIISLIERIPHDNEHKLLINVFLFRLLNLIGQIKSDFEALHIAIYMLVVVKNYNLNINLAPHFARTKYLLLNDLLIDLKEILDHREICFQQIYHNINEGDKKEILKQLIGHVESYFDSKESATMVCQHDLFKEYPEAWKWYFGKYEFGLEDINITFISSDDKYQMFKDGPARDNLLNILNKKTLNSDLLPIMHKFSIQLSDHREWYYMKLSERLKFFSEENKKYHYLIFKSMNTNFDYLYNIEGWTLEKYLDSVKQIVHYENELASLALPLIQSK